MIEREAGRQFDPAVVAAFKARKDGIVAILKQQRAANSTPPLAREGRVGDDRILEKAS